MPARRGINILTSLKQFCLPFRGVGVVGPSCRFTVMGHTVSSSWQGMTAGVCASHCSIHNFVLAKGSLMVHKGENIFGSDFEFFITFAFNMFKY
jgi:hypothetical protein